MQRSPSSHDPEASSEDAPTGGRLTVPTCQRNHGQADRMDMDRVLQELPVALVYNGLSHAVLMATPQDLEDLAHGFSLTEGVIEAPHEVQDVEVQIAHDHALIHIEIPQRRFAGLKERRRHLAGRTGCGLCGVESLEALPPLPGRIQPFADRSPIPVPLAIDRALAELDTHQRLHAETGGAHAAAWCTPDGALRLLREDVGRHNALDKLIGALSAPVTDAGFVLVSSRASYEMVLKTARAQLAALVAMSAPTVQAVQVAQATGVGLVARARSGRSVVYHDPCLS